MRPFPNCNRDYFRKRCRSNKHIYKSENILVNEVDNTLSNIINKHKQKFHSFLTVCKTNNKKIMGYPKRVLLK